MQKFGFVVMRLEEQKQEALKKMDLRDASMLCFYRSMLCILPLILQMGKREAIQ